MSADIAASSTQEPLVDSVADWLMSRCLSTTDLEAIFDGCCVRLLAAGVPLWRCHVAFRTLHPLFEAVSLTWHRGEGLQTVAHPHQGITPAWRQSPLYYLIQNELPELRRHLAGEEALVDFPFLAELGEAGGTDYFAFMVEFDSQREDRGENVGIVGSWCTDRAGGFSHSDIRSLKRISRRLAVACKVTTKDEITRNVLTTYLGADAGQKVLDGQIKRGDGQTIDAVIWYSDLRDSTPLAESMGTTEFLQVLNDYFECVAGAVIAHGGEVLHFIGDAVLAIFPIRESGYSATQACESALTAAREAEQRLGEVNQVLEDRGQTAIDFGLGLHLGKVLYGNIGTPDRLEFSVIGPTVNEVARLEELTKTLQRRVLVSGEFSQHLAVPWEAHGSHRLRGVGHPQPVYSPVYAQDTKTGT